MDYIKLNESFVAAVPVPESSSGDTVTYTVIKISDSSTFASGTMTFVSGFLWKCSFNPTSQDVYALIVTDSTINRTVEKIYKARISVPITEAV